MEKLEFKGTKGEWVIEESFDTKYKQKILNISTETIEGLAVVYTGGASMEETQQANAKLIASAPLLLESLQKMLFIFDRDLPDGTIGREVCDKAIKAIEKALK